MKRDPYKLVQEEVLAPPTSLKEKIKYLGPSFILSASIVGSGELIATTTLGAKAGFVTLWVIIISCLVKVAVQVEFGKHTILTGETPMRAFNQLPGKKFGNANWSVWVVLIIMIIKLLQVGGIVGGVAIIMNMALPAISISFWAFIIAVIVAILVYRGLYNFIEKFSLFAIAFFTLFTFASLVFLNQTPYSIQWADVLTGLKFDLPPEAVAIAIGAFGITGVGGDEIIHYNYWCLEKGYARHTGPYEQSDNWTSRAKGWISVMHLDAVIAMIIYTVVTVAFYLLGAAILYAKGDIPQGFSMIESISEIYTTSLGPWARSFFLIGSFIVLFSTLFAALAAWTRQISDVFGRVGWINFEDVNSRNSCISLLAWCIPVLWAAMFVFIKLPVIMVISGGIAGSFLLFVVIFAVIQFRYKRLLPEFTPGFSYDVALWISILTITFVGLYGIVQVI